MSGEGHVLDLIRGFWQLETSCAAGAVTDDIASSDALRLSRNAIEHGHGPSLVINGERPVENVVGARNGKE
ncbi:hypothetical protein OHB49_11400 [Streptomyces sp. NBC_01717]|uniref:hypothetical protein n=1 Tax=Streptomyces sp. NBC_01717 TaxID=2975918 RepID=UPI002E32B8EF|nr:hypothetical protein [Streptomyces sp. NBC_01717]